MAITASTSVPVLHPDSLSLVGLERSHLRSAVYRRVFGNDTGPLRIGRYSLLERVGSGARGVVFKAFDNQLDRLVALKVLSARADDHDELLREAKALARLSHPNVLPVYEVGETQEGQVFLATEYVKGWTLRGWYDEETRGEAAIVDVIRQVARGVQAAHDEGLVHRDVKPANILLGEDGRVRVADFGLARFDPSALPPASNISRDTVATTTAGTPGYMAPELFRGTPASAASDQYAIAVTLHELVMGALPDASSEGPLRRASKSVAHTLARALAETPEERFASVGAFADALAARSGSAWRRRTPWLVGAAALGSAAAAIFFGEPEGERRADNELALLRAQAELPTDPSAALEALHEAPELSDPRLLPTADQAMALGPEDARYTLPVGAHQVTLLGDVLTFWDAEGKLEARRLGQEKVVAANPEALGLERPPAADGRMVIGSLHEGVRVRNASTLAQGSRSAARAHALQSRRTAFSGDGQRIASIDPRTQVLTVKDTASAELLWSHEPPVRRLVSTALDTSGDRVAWVDDAGTASVLTLSTGTLQQLEPKASDLWFEPGRDSVVVRGRTSGLYQVNLATGQTNQLLDDELRFGRVDISQDGTWIAAQGPRDQISVTNLVASAPRTLRGDAFDFSPDGARLAVRDGTSLAVYDLESGDRHVMTAPGNASQFSFLGAETLWSVGPSGVVRRFTVPSTVALTGHSARVYAIDLSHDGALVASSAGDYTIRSWDVASKTEHTVVELDYIAPTLALDARGERIVATQYNGGPTEFFALETGERTGEAPHSAARPVVRATGEVVGAGKDGVWRHSDGQTTMLANDVGACIALAVSAEWIGAVCDNDSPKLHVWEGASHTSTPLEGRGFRPSLHVWPDASHLYYLSDREELLRRTPNGFEALGSPHRLSERHPVSVLSSSSRNSDLLVGATDGVHALWSPATPPVQLLAEPSDTTAIALSGDGQHFAYATERHQIVVRERPVSKDTASLEAILTAAASTEGAL